MSGIYGQQEKKTGGSLGIALQGWRLRQGRISLLLEGAEGQTAFPRLTQGCWDECKPPQLQSFTFLACFLADL